jgi:hypothetical protein
VTVGSIIAGFVMLVALCCGAVGYVGLMVMARVDQKQKLEHGANQADRLSDLKEVAMAIDIFAGANQRCPANLDELKPFLQSERPAARIRKGEIEVVWQADLAQQQEAGSSNVLIAWDTQPTSDNKRLVVFMDTLARPIDESAFLQTPKARIKPQ